MQKNKKSNSPRYSLRTKPGQKLGNAEGPLLLLNDRQEGVWLAPRGGVKCGDMGSEICDRRNQREAKGAAQRNLGESTGDAFAVKFGSLFVEYEIGDVRRGCAS
jgi:hypothetical protein